MVNGITKAVAANILAYDEMRENEVKVAFDKYDADGSGAIDKEELGELSKELGHELTPDELDIALKDLDLNGDGVIDMKEFSRWWFTGKKEFNGSRRTMLKAGNVATKLISTVGDATRQALLSEPLDTKTHTVSIGFNAPAKPAAGTTISASIYPFGAEHHAIVTK